MILSNNGPFAVGQVWVQWVHVCLSFGHNSRLHVFQDKWYNTLVLSNLPKRKVELKAGQGKQNSLVHWTSGSCFSCPVCGIHLDSRVVFNMVYGVWWNMVPWYRNVCKSHTCIEILWVQDTRSRFWPHPSLQIWKTKQTNKQTNKQKPNS